MRDVLSRGRSLSAAASVAAAALMSGSLAQAQTLPHVQFDLRVAGSGDKSATLVHDGEFVIVDLFATASGLDANATNDSLSIASGNFHTSTGGLLGDLRGIASPWPFNNFGSTVGRQIDLDGDGDLDIGSNDVNNGSDSYSVRTGVLVDNPPGGQWLGRVLLTAADVTADGTLVDFAQRPISTFQAFFDGALTPYAPGRFTFGSSPLSVMGAPAADAPPATLLDGTIDTHLLVKQPTRVTPGASLDLTLGLEVTDSGTLERGDGTLAITVNDVISRNAGGRIDANRITIGAAANGAFTQAGGFTRADLLAIGGTSGITGVLDVRGGKLRATNLAVATGGTLEHRGGESVINSLIASREGAINVRGGTMLVLQDARIGASGAATLTQLGGQLHVGNALQLGAGFGSSGTAVIGGGAVEAARINVGGAGSTGQVQHSLGTVGTGALTVGHAQASGMNTYALSNAGELGASSITVVNNGLITQAGGSASVVGFTNAVSVRNAGFSPAQYHIAGGTLDTPTLNVQHTNVSPVAETGMSGGFAQTGGTVNASRVLIDPAGTYEMTGGTLNVASQLSLRGTMDFGGGNAVANFLANSFADFTQGQILNALNATFTGGTNSLMSFASQEQFDGVGTVDTLGSVHIAGQPLAIAQEQSIAGSGTVRGDVSNDGAVAPGNSPGTLSIDGSFTQSATGALLVEMAGTGEGDYDLLDISGEASLDGELSISLLDGFMPSASDSFTILRASSLAGAFANAGDTIELSGGRFDVSYATDAVTLSNFQAVPEPAGAVFASVAGLALLRRRRRES